MSRRTTHRCYAPWCTKNVENRRLMCLSHWRRLPKDLQKPIWTHYKEGQKITGSQSLEYIAAVKAAVQYYVKRNRGTTMATNIPLQFDPDGGPSDPQPSQ